MPEASKPTHPVRASSADVRARGETRPPADFPLSALEDLLEWTLEAAALEIYLAGASPSASGRCPGAGRAVRANRRVLAGFRTLGVSWPFKTPRRPTGGSPRE
jgi:hypothetical protein